MLYAVIMAGGSGTRFWPESRAQRPKQLLTMIGQRSMIQSTVDRLEGLLPRDRVLIATTAALAPAMREQLPELPAEAILAEPCKRDTAPCIALAAALLARRDPEATMLVAPADHVITDAAAFCQAMRFAAALVDQQPGRIVTFGIKPSYPAESFGYIERAEPLPPPAGLPAPHPPAFRVRQFREKPQAELARQFVEAGTFYWNSGIFLWKVRTILEALARHQGEIYQRIQRIAAAAGTAEFEQVLQSEFEAMRPISIDYAVMEHAADVAVVEAAFPWDDVGSWQAIGRLCGSDTEGNTVAARFLGLQSKGTIVRSSDPRHLIVTVGLEDCIVVHTPDATLVAAKSHEESIRQVVKLLQERGLGEYL